MRLLCIHIMYSLTGVKSSAAQSEQAAQGPHDPTDYLHRIYGGKKANSSARVCVMPTCRYTFNMQELNSRSTNTRIFRLRCSPIHSISTSIANFYDRSDTQCNKSFIEHGCVTREVNGVFLQACHVVYLVSPPWIKQAKCRTCTLCVRILTVILSGLSFFCQPGIAAAIAPPARRPSPFIIGVKFIAIHLIHTFATAKTRINCR